MDLCLMRTMMLYEPVMVRFSSSYLRRHAADWKVFENDSYVKGC